MFQPPKYIQSSFSIFFPRQEKIRRKVNDFEDVLIGRYSQPQVVPVPDDLDPGVPRILFDSLHGYSQIVISQINMSLNVNYSQEWQDDISKGQEYLTERVPILFDLVGKLNAESKIHYCGIVTRARLISIEDDKKIIDHMSNIFQLRHNGVELHDLEIKRASTIEERFFSNTVVKNYRTWRIPEDSAFHPPRMNDNQVIERGIEIIGDFNDRYKYNQDSRFFSDSLVANDIIRRGIDEVKLLITHIGGRS